MDGCACVRFPLSLLTKACFGPNLVVDTKAQTYVGLPGDIDELRLFQWQKDALLPAMITNGWQVLLPQVQYASSSLVRSH